MLQKIVHQIASATHRARAFTEDESEGYQKSRLIKALNEYDNVEWQSTEKSDRIQKFQDWGILYDEDKSLEKGVW